MNENTTNMHPTLEEVRDKLEHWRKIKRNHREPIPKDLWQAATELARKHSVQILKRQSYIGKTHSFTRQNMGHMLEICL